MPSVPAAKQRADQVARAAGSVASCFEAGQTIMLGAGKVALAVADTLSATVPLHVVTNCIATATRLSKKSAVRITLLGGDFNRQSGDCCGTTTLSQVNDLQFSWLLIEDCRLIPEKGLYTFDDRDARLKRAMAQRSQRIVASLEGSEIDSSAPFEMVGAAFIDQLVIRSPITDGTLSRIRMSGLVTKIID